MIGIQVGERLIEGVDAMRVYQVYARRKDCDPSEQGELIGALPQKRENETIESALAWADKVFGPLLGPGKYIYLSVVEI